MIGSALLVACAISSMVLAAYAVGRYHEALREGERADRERDFLRDKLIAALEELERTRRAHHRNERVGLVGLSGRGLA